jgi:hypothetical protein
MSAPLISQDVVPIGSGYVILMGVLAAGLRLLRRDSAAASADKHGASEPEPGTGEPEPGTGASEPVTAGSKAPQAADGSGGKEPSRVARRARPGWPRFAVQTGGTALGGYVVLMAVVLLYYYGVARVANQFLASAFTGCALLLAVSLPVFALVSWVTVTRRRRAAGGSGPAARNAQRAPPR